MPRETQEFELTSQNHSAAPKRVSLQAALCYSSPTQYPRSGEMMPGAQHAGKHCQEKGKPGIKQAEQPTISVLESWEQESCKRGERRETHCQWHPAQGGGLLRKGKG